MPKVSIIIPTYNREQFIGQAILSVLEQSFTDFEIIVVDDGSTDNTKNVIETFDDPRVQYYYQENKGRSVARNYALLLAKGKYITFLDSDDLYLSNKLELQVNYLDLHSDISMIYTSANCIDENGNFLQHKYEASTSGWIYKDIAFFIPVTITLPTVMVRREVFDSAGYFDEKMHRFEDTDMWRRISKFYRIMAIPIYTCNLRTHKDNHLINQDPKVIESSLRYYSKKIINEDQEFDLHLRKSGIAGMYNHYGYAMLGVEQFRETGNKMIAIAKQFHNPPPLIRFFHKSFNLLRRVYHLIKLKNIK